MSRRIRFCRAVDSVGILHFVLGVPDHHARSRFCQFDMDHRAVLKLDRQVAVRLLYGLDLSYLRILGTSARSTTPQSASTRLNCKDPRRATRERSSKQTLRS